MEWHVKFKGTRVPWPASRLSCLLPLQRKDASAGDYLHGLIAVSIRRERRNFFASYKGAAAVKKKIGRRKDEERRMAGRWGKGTEKVRRISLSINTMESAILRLLERNEPIR